MCPLFVCSLVYPDVNECILQMTHCHELEECYNSDGSYQCVCMHGYQTNGSHCVGENTITFTTIEFMVY